MTIALDDREEPSSNGGVVENLRVREAGAAGNFEHAGEVQKLHEGTLLCEDSALDVYSLDDVAGSSRNLNIRWNEVSRLGLVEAIELTQQRGARGTYACRSAGGTQRDNR